MFRHQILNINKTPTVQAKSVIQPLDHLTINAVQFNANTAFKQKPYIIRYTGICQHYVIFTAQCAIQKCSIRYHNSICLFICYTHALWRNGKTYQQTLFTSAVP